MSEVCIEHCAIYNDCSYFEPKPGMNIGDMPRFPLNETKEMTEKEKFTAIALYLARVVDHLIGFEDGHTNCRPIRRQILHGAGSRCLLEDLKVEDLLPGLHKPNRSPENRKKLEDPGVGS